MFHRILVPLDGSALAEQALATAATVAARAAGASGGIELVYVDTNANRTGKSGNTTERVYVNGIAEEASRLLGLSVRGIVVEGDPADAIVRRARETDADLIVMTTHGRTGFSRAIIGSVADDVVRAADRPVLLERPHPDRRWRTAQSGGFHTILVPIDGTDEARSVIAPVLDLCRWMKARLVLVRVVFPVIDMLAADGGVPVYGVVDEASTRRIVTDAQDALTKVALDIESDRRLTVETAVEVGSDIGKTLLLAIQRENPDLVAMATHSRGMTRLIAGSVTDKLLRGTELPLLLLHPSRTQAISAEPLVALATA